MTTAPKKGKGAASPKTSAKGAAKKATAAKKTAAKTAPKEAVAASKPVAAKEAAATSKSAAAKELWNPRIVVFACNWCSYAGADTAGVSRIQHQPHFRMIRVMCSGRIQPGFVLHAFEKGADGVLVSGCHFGDCHYVFGNERAVEQFEITKNVVKLLGIEESRLRLEWISAAEGVRFAEVINEFTDQVRDLGPSPLTKKREAA
jgi:F420-non-reducing hydrogenase iron-sulfur subunit